MIVWMLIIATHVNGGSLVTNLGDFETQKSCAFARQEAEKAAQLAAYSRIGASLDGVQAVCIEVRRPAAHG